MAIDVERLMTELAGRGATVILKVDHERVGAAPWTVVVSGPAVGADGFVRAEEPTLGEALARVVARLRDRGPEWDWLAAG